MKRAARFLPESATSRAYICIRYSVFVTCASVKFTYMENKWTDKLTMLTSASYPLHTMKPTISAIVIRPLKTDGLDRLSGRKTLNDLTYGSMSLADIQTKRKQRSTIIMNQSILLCSWSTFKGAIPARSCMHASTTLRRSWGLSSVHTDSREVLQRSKTKWNRLQLPNCNYILILDKMKKLSK